MQSVWTASGIFEQVVFKKECVCDNDLQQINI